MLNTTFFAYAILFGLTLGSAFLLIPVHVNLLLTSFTIIHIGSRESMRQLDSDNEEDQKPMSLKDAWMFPVVGSAVLLSLYLAFKFGPVELLNSLLTLYFSAVGVLALTGVLAEGMHAYYVKPSYIYTRETPIPYTGIKSLKITVFDVFSFCLSAAIGVWYGLTKHWIANNLFGIAFCIQGIQQVSLGSFKVGAALLSGLFVYDIFWVFGTDVMVSVATKLDAPIKLLFVTAFETPTTDLQHSLLGLGDIVIPGIFIALLLRFDLNNAIENNLKSSTLKPDDAWKQLISRDSPSTPVYNATIAAYVMGLMTTVFVMRTFNAAQPALLYLVPACLVASTLAAVLTGQLPKLWQYEESEKPAPKDD